MPSYSSAEIERALRRAGFALARIRGSHAHYWRREARGRRFVSVPLGRRDLAPGTLHSILRQAGWSEQDLRRLLGR